VEKIHIFKSTVQHMLICGATCQRTNRGKSRLLDREVKKHFANLFPRNKLGCVRT